jgi:Transposase and inactivated derivatives
LRWQKIKNLFSRKISLVEERSSTQIRRGERNIWQRRYWAHTILNEKDYAAHIDYVYINPVKHGLVQQVKDWPYSSFHRDVDQGIYPLNWAGCSMDLEAGERQN